MPVERDGLPDDPEVFAGGGEMGRQMASMDWSSSPLGPVRTWPQSRRTAVSLCLASNFPISMVWGPHCVQIYDDGYWPVCGAKHPTSMGQDFRECWRSAWPAVGAAFEAAQQGRTSYLENQRMFPDRNGYLEETFFTFSFSPIRDESGVGGLFHPVTETSETMLAERRTATLRDLAARTGKAQSVDDACAIAARVLAVSDLDVPFALVYLLDSEGSSARLVGTSGVDESSSACPALVDLRIPFDTASAWPLDEVTRSTKAELVQDVAARFGLLSCGPYPEPPASALVLPLPRTGTDRLAGILVAGGELAAPAQRGVPRILRPRRRTRGELALERSRLRSGARTIRGTRRSRPDEDRVLRGRQPRVPHAAHARARAA